METASIPLAKSGQVALVDADVAHLVSRHTWFLDRGFVVRNVRRRGHLLKLRLHRELLGAAAGQRVCHRNGDKLDNRRSNLLFARVRSRRKALET